MKAFPIFTTLFSKNTCFSCGKEGKFLCHSCAGKIKLYSPYCYWCKKPSQDFLTHSHCRQYFPLSQVIVLSHYHNSPTARLLKHAKYYGKYPIYNDILIPHSNFLAKYIHSDSILIPVPMHFLRKWKREYNQSEALSHPLSHICKISVNNSLIKRVKYTKQQSRLSQSERLKNLDGAFILQKNSLSKYTPIYLVDDIVSTGATLIEIAKLLQENGFQDIRAFCIASD